MTLSLTFHQIPPALRPTLFPYTTLFRLSVPVGAVRLTDVFSASGSVPQRKLALMRAFVREAFDSLPRDTSVFSRALGSSGTINAVVGYAARQGKAATRDEVARATEELAAMPVHERRQRFDV